MSDLMTLSFASTDLRSLNAYYRYDSFKSIALLVTSASIASGYFFSIVAGFFTNL